MRTATAIESEGDIERLSRGPEQYHAISWRFVSKNIPYRDTQTPNDLLYGAKCYVLFRLLQALKRRRRDAQPPSEGAERLIASCLPQINGELPLVGDCLCHRDIFVEKMTHIWDKLGASLPSGSHHDQSLSSDSLWFDREHVSLTRR